MKIRHSDEYLNVVVWRKKLEDDLVMLAHSLEMFDNHFGGVMYEEYRIKEEDEKK